MEPLRVYIQAASEENRKLKESQRALKMGSEIRANHSCNRSSSQLNQTAVWKDSQRQELMQLIDFLNGIARAIIKIPGREGGWVHS